MTPTASSSPTPGYLARLGPLRGLLILAAALVIIAAPFADGSTHMNDWRLLTSVVAPTFMMMLVFALPLDITMTRVFMSDTSAEERARLRFVIRVEIVTYLAMLAAWTPFLLRLLGFSLFD